jgi:hypothetical protein
MEVPLHCQPIYSRPWEVAPDSAWMLMAKVVEVPASEPEIGDRRYVEVPDSEAAMYELDEAMEWTDFFPQDWPLQVLN